MSPYRSERSTLRNVRDAHGANHQDFYNDKRFKNGCHGKFRYPSKGHAESSIDEHAPRTGFKSILRAYKCKMCGSWHLGNTSPDVEAASVIPAGEWGRCEKCGRMSEGPCQQPSCQ